MLSKADQNETTPLRDWSPFQVLPRRKLPQRSRSIQNPEGIADRLRAAAFAEVQARDAFLWAAERFTNEAPAGLCEAWRFLAQEEHKHLNWLLDRLSVLGFGVGDRAVSDHLWVSLVCTRSAKEFSQYMANAEERGRLAGEKFYTDLELIDPISAAIFKQIALEERAHVELALKHYPEILLSGASKPAGAASSLI